MVKIGNPAEYLRPAKSIATEDYAGLKDFDPEQDLPTIDDENECFWSDRKAITRPKDGWRQISRWAVLSEEYTPSDNVMITIPQYLYSIETLQFMGFTVERAKEIYTCWATQPSDMGYAFYQAATDATRRYGVQDAFAPEDDGSGCLDALGINEETKSRLLDPRFTNVRCTIGCKSWAFDTVEKAFFAVADFNNRLTDYRLRIQKSSTVGQSPPVSPREVEGIEKGRAYTKDRTRYCRRWPSQRPEIGPPGSAPTHIYDHTMLYHADLERNHVLFPSKDRHCDGRRFNMRALAVQHELGDFDGGLHSTAYLTPQKELAGLYAAWIKHRIPYEYVTVLQIAMPNAVIEFQTSKVTLLFDSVSRNLWKEMVHTLHKRWARWPKHFRRLEEIPLWIGHVSTGINQEALGNWRNINADHVLKVKIEGESRCAIQWAFRDVECEEDYTKAEAEEIFESCDPNKVWITRFTVQCIGEP